MEKRRLGNTDMEVSVIGFGGAEIGAQEIAQGIVTQLLNSALDAGLNLIDTASAYWKSELMIGEAVSHRRKEFYLLSKCGATDGFNRYDWSKPGILSQIERSLKNLKTDYLDLVQLHSCEIAVLKKGEAIEALHEARERGYSRYIGYSGDSQAAKYAIETGVFDTLQTSISIADQESIELTLPLAKASGLGVIAKRPVANAAWRTGRKPSDPYHHAYWNRLKKLDYDFLKDNLQNSISTALRFTLSQDGVATAIVGTTRPGRWRENAELLEEGPLDTAEIALIRARWMQVADASWVGQV
jgi:aryl-alcohol dehydrogenase-like predicted oxidoreductase